LWEAVTRDVRPLDPGRLPVSVALPPEPAPPDNRADVASSVPSAPPRPPGPVDRSTVERLKRGQVAIEARIDLHGMDQRAAFAALTGFVDGAMRQGRRALLVITGKGALSEGGGVLRRNAPDWLMASPLAARILAIVPAHNRHGGDGAFYVLIRRQRDRR
jgi:DNA-nicking Smr family endonuclease